MSRRNGHDLKNEWKGLVGCLKESIRLQPEQHDEAVCDFIAAEILADALSRLPEELRRSALVSAMQGRCHFAAGSEGSFNLNPTRTHPEPEFRVGGIFGGNARLRESIGCGGKASKYPVCSLRGAAE